MSEQLAKARVQLSQVETLLQDDPKNEDLLELARELREAVVLAEALVERGTQKDESGPLSSGWVTTTTTATGKKNLKSSSNGGVLSSSTSQFLEILVGQRCEVKSKTCKRWNGAVVLKRLPDYKYLVERLFDSKELEVDAKEEELREMNPPSLRHDSLVPGLRVRARFSQDGKYYQAVVDKRSEHGCFVKFEGYEDDEAEQVALEHVRISFTGEAESVREKFQIPKNLVVNPDDSEEVKTKKIRQQRSLKKKLRENVEKEHIHKQDNWLAFQATNKRVKGALTNISSTSQFSFSGKE